MMMQPETWGEKTVFAVADVGYCPVKLGMMSNRLQSGVNTLQGFREDKRNRITPGTALPLCFSILLISESQRKDNKLSVCGTFHSVLHELWAIHLLRANLRLQLCQHQQGRFWPYLLFLWRRVQPAGLRQVWTACLCKDPSSVAFTQRGIPHWLLSRCSSFSTGFSVSGGGQL